MASAIQSDLWNLFKAEPVLVELDEENHPFKQQLKEVKEIITTDKILNEARVQTEIHWFYGGLGLDNYYFETHTAKEIAGHIISLYSAKSLAQFNGTDLEFSFQNLKKGRALFLARSMPGNRNSPCVRIEQKIEEMYLGQAYRATSTRHVIQKKDENLWRLQCFRTAGAVSPSSSTHLRLYFLSEPNFINPKPAEGVKDLNQIADSEFLNSIEPSTKNSLQEMIDEGYTRISPVIRLLDTDKPNHKQLMVLFYHGTTHSYFSGLTSMYHSLGLYSTSKYVEHFSNGMMLFSVYLDSLADGFTPEVCLKLIEETNLIYMLPRTTISFMVEQGILTIAEHAYAYAGWKFAFQFLSRQSVEFAELAHALRHDPVASGVLARIKGVMRKEAYTEGRILEPIIENPQLIKELYQDFEKHHRPNGTPKKPTFNEEIALKIKRNIHDELNQQVLQAFLIFNQHILKTNFFKNQKVALSFRLDPNFLAKNFPVVPFGMFFVLGAEFRGYHIRFRDVARGGIRIIRSNNLQAFTQNVVSLFDENYNLAATQNRKNKDIPEGGSKGTILLSPDHFDKSFTAFKKYVDSILDLLLPGKSIVDHYGSEEILFLGPDEGTADMMNWASSHAQERGYKFWKAFTTGKSRDRGGIPHDMYGMTTRSIHQYVLGILEKLNLSESECSKFQTGGPDGDLGSNEIKISKDKTVAIVDGSGVLYDPKGLNREELTKCAESRSMTRNFDKSKLSPNGFFVDVEERDITLPNGTSITSGLEFRNRFHLNPLSEADIFVPCGGRPESVNLSNYYDLVNPETKKPRFHVIVEGANLFFTQEARLQLEKLGAIIIKDASANKGGVTSSSLEVLAALALTDEEFEEHMTVKDGREPDFYRNYVQDVQKIIEGNARSEFECIWSEREKTGTPNSILSDQISMKIVDLSANLENSKLFNNEKLRNRVLEEFCPKTLIKLLGGVDAITKRIPESYLKAIFSRYITSRYIYQFGNPSNPEFSFYNFIEDLLEKSN